MACCSDDPRHLCLWMRLVLVVEWTAPSARPHWGLAGGRRSRTERHPPPASGIISAYRAGLSPGPLAAWQKPGCEEGEGSCATETFSLRNRWLFLARQEMFDNLRMCYPPTSCSHRPCLILPCCFSVFPRLRPGVWKMLMAAVCVALLSGLQAQDQPQTVSIILLGATGDLGCESTCGRACSICTWRRWKATIFASIGLLWTQHRAGPGRLSPRSWSSWVLPRGHGLGSLC